MTLMDEIAVWSLVAAAVAAGSSVVMLIRSWNAATTKDLKRVEANTADTVLKLADVHDHLATMNLRLDAQEALAKAMMLAQHVALTVEGRADKGQPLEAILTVLDQSVAVTRIELCNELGVTLGSVECSRKDPHQPRYIATIHPTGVDRWYSSGVGFMLGSRSMTLRVHMVINDQNVYRDFAVTVSAHLVPDGQCETQHAVMSLSGSSV